MVAGGQSGRRAVLVVGGAGYIGSHVVKALLDGGYDTTIFDNLFSGHRDTVLGGCFVQGDLADTAALDTVRAVAGRTVPVRTEARRTGDPARLVADSTRARQELGWTPRYPGLHDFVDHAWLFGATMQRSSGNHGVAGIVAADAA